MPVTSLSPPTHPAVALDPACDCCRARVSCIAFVVSDPPPSEWVPLTLLASFSFAGGGMADLPAWSAEAVATFFKNDFGGGLVRFGWTATVTHTQAGGAWDGYTFSATWTWSGYGTATDLENPLTSDLTECATVGTGGDLTTHDYTAPESGSLGTLGPNGNPFTSGDPWAHTASVPAGGTVTITEVPP